jgi:MFS transporter, SHS family, lactate transporter
LDRHTAPFPRQEQADDDKATRRRPSGSSTWLAVPARLAQGDGSAWGVVPAHLNELSPSAARATIPAFVYQAGNFLASYNAPFQAQIAEAHGGNYAYALALVAGAVAVAMIVVIASVRRAAASF